MNDTHLPTRLRLWPGVVIVVLQWSARYLVPALFPGTLSFGVMAGLGAGFAIVVWWAFFSRAPWLERIVAITLMAAAIAVTPHWLHVSVATAGQGFLFYLYAVPLVSLAFVVWAALARGLGGRARYATMIAAIVMAAGVWTLLRTGGITGDVHSDFAFRWSKSPEERLLETGGDLPVTLMPARVIIEADWPGFRGPARDSVLAGARIETDWSSKPPVELWRRAVGPGWSSFAIGGGRLYTQEQRGEEEIVACYRADTGELVWKHGDLARFYESNGGAGPRGTPTLRDGRVYTFGATGILNVLDAGNGALVWSRNVATDADTELPGWGFASSPLVIDDIVVIAAAGRLVAYDIGTGEPRWFGPAGFGYSSPHPLVIDGVEQLVLMSDSGAAGFVPSTGTQLWEHPWKEGSRIVQPALTADGDLLISGGEGRAMRRIALARGPDGWTVEERWTSIRLRPYFNDFVVHEGHAYGFDGRILACLDTADGARAWKGGRYGHGQLLLLPDQDLLLVLSEQGELALVRAAPDRFTELARFPAIEGKTWNHPVLIDDQLFVRNGEEMAAFRLSLPSS